MLRKNVVMVFNASLLLLAPFSNTFVQAEEVTEIAQMQAAAVDLDVDQNEAESMAKQALENSYSVNLDGFVCKAYIVGTPMGGYWNVEFSGNVGDKKITYTAIISQGTGKISSLSRNSDVQLGEPISDQKAKEIADEYLKKTKPDYFERVKQREKIVGVNGKVKFIYYMVHNDIPILKNYINVTVDKNTAEVTGVEISNWLEDLVFPTGEVKMSAKEAKDIIKSSWNMQLHYSNEGNSYMDLIYALDNERGTAISTINAITGEQYKVNYKPNPYNNNAEYEKLEIDITARQKTNMVKRSLKQKELLAKDKTNNTEELRSNRAKKLLKSYISQLTNRKYVVDKMELVDAEYPFNVNGIKKVWKAKYGLSVNDSFESIGEVKIDAVSGNLLSLKNQRPYNSQREFTPRITWEDAYYRALDRVENLYQQYMADIDTKVTQYKPIIRDKANDQSYRFVFPRMVNGVKLPSNIILIEFDAETREVIEFRIDWGENLSFADRTKAISLEEAKDILFKDKEYELFYDVVDKKDGDNEVRLIYKTRADDVELFVNYRINAINGIEIGY